MINEELIAENSLLTSENEALKLLLSEVERILAEYWFRETQANDLKQADRLWSLMKRIEVVTPTQNPSPDRPSKVESGT